jgi:hypothetical protein
LLHLMLEVKDDGGSAGKEMALTSFLIQVTNKELKSGGMKGGEAIGDMMARS